MTVAVTTLLGDNTVEPLRRLADDLRAEGLAVSVDDEPDWGARQARLEQGRFDLVWACGLLTRSLIAAGADLEPLAVPILIGETEPVYRSVVVGARNGAGRPGPGRLAVNDFGSWSGWHGYVSHLTGIGRDPRDLWSETVVCGSHVGSMEAVAAGRADVASVDVSVWRHQPEHGGLRSELRVLGVTGDWPAPPLSVRAGLPVEVRRCIATVLASRPDTASATAADYDHMLHEAGLTEERVGSGFRR